MIRKSLFTISLAISAAVLVFAQSGPALTGIVLSQAEGPMEGVVVSAKRAGSTMTLSVTSDAQGRYAFPANRLEPGSYTIRVRATGYDLEGPSTVDVAAGRPAQLDLKLGKTKDLAAQLTNGEWFISWPGTTEMKNGLLNCTQCHTLERVARSTHDARQATRENGPKDNLGKKGHDISCAIAGQLAAARAWSFKIPIGILARYLSNALRRAGRLPLATRAGTRATTTS